MNKKKPARFHDPKIEPRPPHLVQVTVEFTKDELHAIDGVVRTDGYGSRDEFLRAATAQGIRSYRKENP